MRHDKRVPPRLNVCFPQRCAVLRPHGHDVCTPAGEHVIVERRDDASVPLRRDAGVEDVFGDDKHGLDLLDVGCNRRVLERGVEGGEDVGLDDGVTVGGEAAADEGVGGGFKGAGREGIGGKEGEGEEPERVKEAALLRIGRKEGQQQATRRKITSCVVTYLCFRLPSTHCALFSWI